MNCNCVNPKPKCSEVNGITIVIIPESLGDDSQDSIYAPTIGAYKNAVVKYLANGYVYVYDKDGAYTMIGDSDAVDIEVDQILDVKSKNAVANQAVSKALVKLTETVAKDYAELSSKTTELGEKIDTLDGSLAKVAKTGDYKDLLNQPVVDTALSTASRNAVENRAITTAINAEKAARESADAGIRSDVTTIDTAINKDVVTDIKLDPTPSTTLVNLDATKTNIKTSTSTTSSFPLPVASSTQAGVINSATYNSIREAIQIEQAVVHGAVAITGLPMSPTQQEITDAWKNATGLTDLVNRAEVYDVSHNKVWTYYENDTTWHATSSTTQVTVQQFTNSSLGTIKGSTIDGQIYAETNGTGSVNGWDTLSATVSSSKSKLDTIEQGAEVNVQANWNQTTTTADDYIKNKPNLSTVATSGSYNDLTDRPIDSNTDVGNNVNPIFVKDGILTASTGNVGNKFKPTYMANGNITASDATVGGSKTPVYMNAGTVTAMDELADVAFSGDYNDLINTPGGGVKIDTTKLRKLVADKDDDTRIENGDDLNDAKFRQIGTYYCTTYATAQSVVNIPSSYVSAFLLEVEEHGGTTYKSEIETESWVYLSQKITDINNNVWYRTVQALGTAGDFTYGNWKKVATIGADERLNLDEIAYIDSEGDIPASAPWVVTSDITDGAVTNTKVSDGAISLNKIDSTTLYNNPSGQGIGNFTLSDAIQNYDTVEIYFKNIDNISGSTKVEISGSTASTTLQVILPGGGTDQAFYVFASHVTFSGTNANHYACKSGYFNNYNQMSVGANSDAIKIYKIVGYK